jgi:flavin-dependent dehydrogenase
MINKNSSIKILGAGLSGLSAAILLAREDYLVEVYEKGNHIGGRFQKNICSIRNYGEEKFLDEISKFGIQLREVNSIKKAVKISENYEHVVENENSLYSIVIRGRDKESIENQLYEKAINSGVEVHFNNEGLKYSDIDIFASGSEWMERNVYGVGYRYAKPKIDVDTIYLFYNNNASPLGYTCVVPDGENAIVLSVSFDKSKFAYLRDHLDRYLEENSTLKKIFSNATLTEAIDGFGYYCKDPIENAIHNKKIYIGESAGFLDASRGFGIRYAIITAALAAKSIIEKEDYCFLLKKYFNDEFKENWSKRQKINKLTNEDYDVILSHLGGKRSISEYLEGI